MARPSRRTLDVRKKLIFTPKLPKVISYSAFIDALRSSIEEAKTLRERPQMHEDPDFRRWRHRLESLLTQIVQQDYLLPGSVSVRQRAFGYTDQFEDGSTAMYRYNRDMQDTINELEVIVEAYQHGEPPKKGAERTNSKRANEATMLLRRQIERLKGLKPNDRFSPEFKRWQRDTAIVIEKSFGKGTRHTKEFSDIDYEGSPYMGKPDSERVQDFARGLADAAQMLTSMIEEWEQFGTDEEETGSPRKVREPLSVLTRLADRVPLVVRELRRRHDNRGTLEVKDEYDVQDLLRALLKLEFDDVREEEWTPSYAGGSGRMDFLLKASGIVVETKRASRTLRSKQIGDQLLVDIGRYKAHPDCNALFCFVYDPDGDIANPRGLEVDLTRQHNGLAVHVLVRPLGV
jgi:hypothetical protein